MDVTLVDPDSLYSITVLWENGTESEDTDLNVTIELFHHIQSFTILTDLNLLVRMGSFPGCTHWGVGTTILKSPGEYTFNSHPLINRTECSKDLMAPFGQDRIEQAALLSHLSLSLFVLSVIGTCSLAVELRKRLVRHDGWRTNDPGYRDCDSYEQIHYSIGFWHPIHFVMDLLLVATASVLIWEANTMTQFVSALGMQIFSI
jgi:hypothetical protein